MSTLTRLRRPEFTGANRCWPCTVVNAVLLAVVVALVGAFEPLVAAALAVAGVAGLYFRGYLVPYTPRFAPKLVAALPGDWFTHGEAADSLRGVGPADRDPDAVLESMVAAGVVTTADGRLGIDEDVAAAWKTRMGSLAEDPQSLVEIAERDLPGIDAARIEHAGDETYLVVTGGSAAWLRLPIAVAEIGAVEVLADTDLPGETRGVAAHALCAFLDSCPVCGSDLVEGPADDCCGHTLAEPGAEPPTVLACDECSVAFYTLENGTDE